MTIPLSRAATVEISEGRPSKTRRVLSWGVGGLLAGGALGAVYGNGESTQVDQTCLSDAAFFGFPQSECERSEKRGTGKWAGIGGGVGAVLGALLGSVTGGETWTPVQGLEVGLSVRHQGVQVSLRF